MTLSALTSLWAHQPMPLLGLDISTSSARLVELGLDKAGQLVVQRCAAWPLGSGWVVDGGIGKFDELVDAVRRLVKKSGTKTKNVAMALPPTAVITKKVKLRGGMSARELELQVEIEANQYVPFPMDEVSLDFCIVGPCPEHPGDIEVLIAASRRGKVQDIQGLAEAAGLKPVILDVSSYASRSALSRLTCQLPKQGLGSVVALFELGSHASSMQVICNGDVLYDRDQAFGGAQLTQLIAQHFGWTIEVAEAKKLSGEAMPDYETRVLRPFVESLSRDIHRALALFLNSTVHNQVDFVVLAGGSAVLAGLPACVTAHTTYPCLLANPFDGMTISTNVTEKNMTTSPAYLTACGLALRRFTL